MHPRHGYEAATRSTRRRLLAVLPLAGTLVALPAAALARTPHAGSGGNGLTGAPAPASTTPGGSSNAAGALGVTVQANVVQLTGSVAASGNGITFSVAAAGRQGHPLAITGTAPATAAGSVIDIETARPRAAKWTLVATAQIGSNGVFDTVWTPAASAHVQMRAVLAPGLAAGGTSGVGGTSGAGSLPGSASAATAAGVLTTSTVTIQIFKNAVATLYGPGFWGHRTACGERLRRTTLGVASRTLKCGTKVALDFDGRELTVPVIDRGPYGRNRASWDLTEATADALGMTTTSTIGAIS